MNLFRSIVAEVTDDKSLPKMERKRLQIVNAPHKSREAKLVKLADKLYNLRDLKRCTPQGCFISNKIKITKKHNNIIIRYNDYF